MSDFFSGAIAGILLTVIIELILGVKLI